MSERDLQFSEMQAMQLKLWEKYKDAWSPLEPIQARNSFLWMICELGEVLDIIKKKTENAISNDPSVREHFVEELCDVLMYFNDALLRYGISPEELSQAYVQKHKYNLTRDYEKESKRFLEDEN